MRYFLKNFMYKDILIISLVFVFYQFAWSLIGPIFNIWINNISNSLFLSGILFSITSIISIIFDPIFGILSDKISPKKLLTISLIVYIGVFIGYSFTNNVILLTILRILDGFAYACLWVSGWTIIRIKSRGKDSQKKISIWATLQNTVYLFGPIIGGFIAEHSINILFLISGLLILPAVIFSRFINIEKKFRKFKSMKFKKNIYFLVLFMIYFSGMSFYSFITIYLKKYFSIQEISIIYAIGFNLPGVLFSLISGIIGDKYGRKTTLIIGAILSSLIILIPLFQNFFFVLFLNILISTGYTFTSITINAMFNDKLPDRAGSFTGKIEMLKNVSATVGGIVGGLLTSISFNIFFFVLSILNICMILFTNKI